MDVSRPIYEVATLQRIFDRLANTFSEPDFGSKKVMAQMIERMSYIKYRPKTILDIGCGLSDGYLSLTKAFPDAHIYGVDISTEMLIRAKKRLEQTRKKQKLNLKTLFSRKIQPFVAADFSDLPFQAESFEMLWSNQALQWHPRPDLVFLEWYRVLKTEGLLMFSSVGPDTFKELKAVLSEVDGAVPIKRVMNFVDMHDLGDMLLHAGFHNPVMDQESVEIQYETFDALLKDLKAWGQYPFVRNAAQLTRFQYQYFQKAIQKKISEKGYFSLTVEIIYGHAWKEAKKNKDQSIVFVKDIQKNYKNK